MKLLIISPYYYEPHRWMISAYKTATELSKEIPVVVLTTGTPERETIHDRLTIYRIKDIFLPDPINFSFIPGLFGWVKTVMRIEQPDCYLVNKNMFYSSLAIIYLRWHGKKILTQVDTFPGINWFSRNRIVNIVLWIHARTIGMFLLKLSTKVILLHEGLIPVAKKYNLNYTVIHNGVDYKKIEQAEPKKMSEAELTIRIGYFGRLESVKGYIDLLAVAKKLIAKHKNVYFYLVGNSTGKEELIKTYDSSQIKFLGHQADVLPLMKAMDIFVLPSYSEGLPNALMEAMACGVACVASNVGGVKTLIKHDQTGLLFEPGNQEQLQTSLETLINKPQLRKQLGHAAQAVVKKNYNWETISTQLLALLNDNKS